MAGFEHIPTNVKVPEGKVVNLNQSSTVKLLTGLA
jgi:hypothetical protein